MKSIETMPRVSRSATPVAFTARDPYTGTIRSSARLQRLFAAAAVTVAMVAAGCTRAEEVPPIEEAAPPVEQAVPTWSVTGPPELIIDPATQSGQPFERIVSVILRDDGSVVFADGGTGQIRLFDAMGAPLRVVGGLGGGAGEFTDLAWVRPFANDSLLAWDGASSRATVYDGRLEQVRTWSPSVPAGATLSAFGVFTDGSVAALLGPPQLAVSEDGAWHLIDLVRVYPGSEDVQLLYNFHLRRCPYRTTGACPPPPLGDQSNYMVHGNEVIVANTGLAEIEFIDATGAVTGRIPLDRGGRELTPEEIADLEARIDPSEEGLPVPGYLPPFLDLRADSEGNVWILTDLDGTWTVLDRQGRVLRRAQFDPSFRVERISGDRVLGVSQDSVGVERVMVYRIGE